jgi:VanZ family protein
VTELTTSSGRNPLRGLSGPAAALWTALILAVCLTPTGSRSPEGVQLCLICAHDGVADFFLNIALYLPLGFFLRVRTGSTWFAVACGLVLSLSVETSQLFIPGRFTTVADLLANTAGAGLGALLGIRPLSWLLPRAPAAKWASILAAIAAAAAILAPAALVTPTVPGGQLYGNWTPAIATSEPYAGRVLLAEIDELPLPSRALETSGAVRERLERDYTLTLVFEAADPTPGPAPVFRLLDDRAVEAVNISAVGADLHVWVRFRADDLYLDRPNFRFTGALADAVPGDSLTLFLECDSRGMVRAHLEGERLGDRSIKLGIPPGRGWALLFHPSRLPEWVARVFDLAWIALLFLPVGWWGGRSPRGLAMGALPLATLALIPVVTLLLPTPALHYLAGLVGLLGGATLRALAATKW